MTAAARSRLRAQGGTELASTWVQEESRNNGAWTFVHEQFEMHFPHIQIDYIGRDETAATATGSYKNYKKTQQKIVKDALGDKHERPEHNENGN